MSGRRESVGAPIPSRRGLVLLLIVLALVFQGSRGLWEPDEGFYGAAASEMFDRGDWLVPTLEGRPFLDKPPLVYWGGIVGMHLLGRNEWGLRLPLAVALVLAALAIGGIGRTLWNEQVGVVAALVYATSLGPFLAANVLTPDTLLAAAVAGFYLGYVRAEAADDSRGRLSGWLLAGFAAGLGLLAKGPALLLWAAPVPVHLIWRRRLGRALAQPGPWLGAVLALGIGLPWYLFVARSLPGALDYILDSQVVGRLATATYERNADPFDGFAIYLPTVVALSVPWGPLALFRSVRDRRGATSRPRRAGGDRTASALLLLWILLPLGVLLVARSRLPLYALPMSGALALAAAAVLSPSHAPGARGASPARGRAFALWCVVLIAVKGGAALWPSDRDSRAFASEVASAGAAMGGGHFDVVAVDARRQGLDFYLRNEVEQVRGYREKYPFYSDLELLREEIEEASRSGEPAVFVFKRQYLDRGLAALGSAGVDCSQWQTANRQHAIVTCPGRAVARGAPGPGAAEAD